MQPGPFNFDPHFADFVLAGFQLPFSQKKSSRVPTWPLRNKLLETGQIYSNAPLGRTWKFEILNFECISFLSSIRLDPRASRPVRKSGQFVWKQTRPDLLMLSIRNHLSSRPSCRYRVAHPISVTSGCVPTTAMPDSAADNDDLVDFRAGYAAVAAAAAARLTVYQSCRHIRRRSRCFLDSHEFKRTACW